MFAHVFRCVKCGEKTEAFFDRCPQCGRFDTCIRAQHEHRTDRGVRLSEVHTKRRRRTRIREDWDQALGGGFLDGTIVLISGPPGAGKTSDCLSLSTRAGNYEDPALYLTSEWKPDELAARGEELGLSLDGILCERVTKLSDVENAISSSRARFVVLDSWGALRPIPSADELERLRAVLRSSVLVIVLHVTKDAENFAGSQELLHKADAFVWVEPETLAVRKNWHGPPGLLVDRLQPFH
jgi:DNA repair protein RadA/Sms